MNLLKDWPRVRERYLETWALENHDRPLVRVSAPKNAGTGSAKPAPRPASPEEAWLDFDRVIADTRGHCENTHFAGESYPLFCPNLGPDIFGAILGCDITFGESTSWCDHPVKDWAHFTPEYNPDNIWLKRIVELTERAVDDARGDYLVGITDIHAGMDGLVSLRGPAELCMDLYDCPELIRPLPMRLFEVFTRFYNELEAITSRNQEGTSNWMGVWHPGRWYVTSCDFNCLVSNEVFREYVLPELEVQTDFLDANIYHLDGPGALIQLDDILALERVNGVQWVPGAGEKPMREWAGVLTKCQAAGKMLHLSCEPEDLPALSEFLKPEGVILELGWQPDAASADALVRRVEDLWR